MAKRTSGRAQRSTLDTPSLTSTYPTGSPRRAKIDSVPDARRAARQPAGRSPLGWALQAVGTVLAVLIALTMAAGTAAAHTRVTGSTPANGATVKTLDSVSVQFVDPVLGKFAGIAMTTEDDQPVPLSEPVVNDDTLTATVAGPQPAPGLYIVSYRAVSVDGHTITGSHAFTFDPPQTASEQTSDPPSAPAPVSSPEGTTTAVPDNPGSSSVARPLALGLGVAVALLVGAGFWAWRRRAGG